MLPNPYKDAEFGAKLDAIEGLIGFRYEASKFERTALARVLKVHESQIKRKRDGKEPISYHHLSKLIAHFELEAQLDYQAFFLSLPDFKAALKAARVGTHGGSLASLARQELYMMARPGEKKTSERCSLEIVETHKSRRGGGLGFSPIDDYPVPEFRFGDCARLRVKAPSGAGHLVILNDRLDVSISCLMPSCLAPTTAVAGGAIEIPDAEEYEPFNFAGPAGLYRLFAIWSAAEPKLPWISGDPAENSKTLDVRDADLVAFVQDLARLSGTNCPPAIATADYRVLSTRC